MSLPDREAILAFIRQTPGSVGKREIARAFGLRGEAREALKELLREMEEEGLLAAGPGRTLHKAGGLPRVAVLTVVSAEGARLLAVPERWDGDGPQPKVAVAAAGGRGGKRERFEAGDRILTRISGEHPKYLGTVIKRLAKGHATLMGMVRKDERGGLVLRSVDKRERKVWPIHHSSEVQPGELVRAELKGSGARASAHVLERLGDPLTGARVSEIAIAAKGIPHLFPHGVEEDAERESARWGLDPGLRRGDAQRNGGDGERDDEGRSDEGRSDGERGDGERGGVGREDWTRIPFLTIDPADARDHDDAIWAEPEGDGWRLLVAIADVSWFVRPGSALDRSAFDRGNSCYFPDQVVPMLPEALSNGACSLKAGSDKAVLAASMKISKAGELEGFSFHRARVRIAANLAYETAQAVMDGVGTEAASPLPDPLPGPLPAPLPDPLPSPLRGGARELLGPLWDCWRAMAAARARRGPLELELPEKRVVLDAGGRVAGIAIRERLDAHRVVEDMMIAANVAAAKALESKKAPVMYRCHEAPDREKLSSLKEYLGTLGVSFALGQVITPETFNRVLERCRGRDDFQEISEAVLRSQTQAYYAPRNTGHFGLALGSYAHFTSPIRRYADVCVHRSLVSAFRLGEGGLPDGAEQRFAPIGEHISFTERRAMEAERETLDRYIARHLASHVGQVVRARISGVQAFGFFATVDEIGGDGLVPVSALGAERFRFDEAGRFLEGAETGTRYGQGQRLELKLEEADAVTGSLRFSLPGVEPVERGPRFRRDGRGPRRDGGKRGGAPAGVRRGRR